MALKCQPTLNMSLARPPLESRYYRSDIRCDPDDVNNVIAGAEKKMTRRGRKETFPATLEKKAPRFI